MWSRFRETYCLGYKWPSGISCTLNMTNGESMSSNCTASVETNCPIFNLPLDCSSDVSSSLCDIYFSALNLKTTAKHHRENNKHVGLSTYPVYIKYIIVSLWDSSILMVVTMMNVPQGYDTVWSCRNIPTFFSNLFCLEDVYSMFLWNVWRYIPDCTSHIWQDSIV